MKMKAWFKGGILGLCVLMLLIVVLAFTTILHAKFASNPNKVEGVAKVIITPIVALWMPGHYLGLYIPGTGCPERGQVSLRCDNEGFVGAGIANAILYFVVGALIAEIYRRLKKRGLTRE